MRESGINDADMRGAVRGTAMYALATALYPICRSITGDGVRETLARLSQDLPIEFTEVPSGSQVFDWTIPDEWNIKEAWIKDPKGREVLNFSNHNLHVVGYSLAVHEFISLERLKEHLFSLPDQPDLIPYRTSYYRKTWGFCLPSNLLETLEEGIYEVFIDSTLKKGGLSYGELFLPGSTSDEVLVSSHICHPSLANDNLSGIVVAATLFKEIARCPRRLSYRFLFAPGTIGAVAWLAKNQSSIPLIKHGLVLTCVGDSGQITYKKSRRGDAVVDRAMCHVLRQSGSLYRIEDFSPYGYDERQFCSPGLNLPVGCVMRSPHGTFSQYHTNADNLDFIKPQFLEDTLEKILDMVRILETNHIYVNLKPMCEPKLGNYGLYGGAGGHRNLDFDELSLLWVLNQSDGSSDLLQIAERSGFNYKRILGAAEALQQVGLIRIANALGPSTLV